MNKGRFALALALIASTISILPPENASAAGNTIYTVSYSGGLKARPIDGSGTQTTVGSVSAIVDLAASGNYIYLGLGGIKRINSDGTGLTNLRTVSDQMGLFISGSYIYYGYEYGRKIGRMNLDGTGANDSFIDYSSNTSAPYSAQVLVLGSTIYFGGGGNKTGRSIWKVPVSGGTPTLFVDDADQTAGVGNLATDGTYLYWTDYRVGEIGKAAFDGSYINDNFVTGLSAPWGIEYANSYLYYTTGSFIGRAKADGSLTQNSWVSNSSTQGLAIADAGQYSAVDSTPPTFPSADTFSIAENSTSVGNVASSESATISIFSGDDSSFFSLTRLGETSAALSFTSAPDFETPGDVGRNNTYVVVLRALDTALNAGYETVTVTVTDVADLASFNSFGLSNGATLATYRTVVTISANIAISAQVTFLANNKRIAGCIKKSTSGIAPNIVATCSWKPTSRGAVTLKAISYPTNQSFTGSSSSAYVRVGNRSGTR